MQSKLSGLGTGAGLSGVTIAGIWVAKIFLPTELGNLTPEEVPAAREALAGFAGFVLASVFGMGWAWIRQLAPDDLDPPPLQSHPLLSVIALALAVVLAPVSRVALVGVAAVSLSACASLSVPEGASFEHRYFAAVSDYTSAKQLALAWVTLESTPADEARRVLAAARAADAQLITFEGLRAQGAAAENDYAAATAAITTAASLLRSLAASAEAAP